jgi:hypothetical protein
MKAFIIIDSDGNILQVQACSVQSAAEEQIKKTVLPSQRIIPIDRDHEATLNPGQWNVKDGKLKKKS